MVHEGIGCKVSAGHYAGELINSSVPIRALLENSLDLNVSTFELACMNALPVVASVHTAFQVFSVLLTSTISSKVDEQLRPVKQCQTGLNKPAERPRTRSLSRAGDTSIQIPRPPFNPYGTFIPRLFPGVFCVQTIPHGIHDRLSLRFSSVIPNGPGSIMSYIEVSANDVLRH
jgi:hypothetical protein